MSTETIELHEQQANRRVSRTLPAHEYDDDDPGLTETEVSVDKPRQKEPTTAQKSRFIIVIVQLSSIALITSFTTGIIIIGIPAIAPSLHLHESLLVWPYSVFYLTNGSCLLLAGAIADAVGARTVNLLGTFSLATFILACGLVRTGIELIMMRAIQGAASAMVVPSSISLVSRWVPSGRPRNMGFASLGLSMCVGLSLGLVIGGVLIDTLG